MISENTKITLTLGQLRRLVMEGVAAGVAKDAALDAADAAIFGGAPVLKATEKGAEAYLKNDASVAEEPQQEDMTKDLTGNLGQEVHIGSNGLPEYMTFKSGGKDFAIEFDANGKINWETITDADGNSVSLKALAGGVAKMGAMKKYINTCFTGANAESGVQATLGAATSQSVSNATGNVVKQVATQAAKQVAGSASSGDNLDTIDLDFGVDEARK